MKWEGHRQSDNVEDRRGSAQRAPGGLRLGGGRGIGLGSIVIALLAGWMFGINPLTVLGLLGGGGAPAVETAPPAAPGGARPPSSDPRLAFVSTVLADTEDVWTPLLRSGGQPYRAPRLVVFDDATRSACGQGVAAMGPFYCPGDQTVYIDLGFFETLHQRLGAPGDFAQAYVIAHEVGHHVQYLLGISDKVDALRGRATETQMNALSVRTELQADCFAGVWANRSQQGKDWLEQGDLEEAMHAAAQIGDDTLQRRSQGRVVPETFTHGTSQQRQRWFGRGWQSGTLAQCNTFDAPSL